MRQFCNFLPHQQLSFVATSKGSISWMVFSGMQRHLFFFFSGALLHLTGHFISGQFVSLSHINAVPATFKFALWF